MGQTQKVTMEQALAEVEAWLDLKKYPRSKREKNKDQIEAISDAICDGVLSISDSGEITHQLGEPVTDKDNGDVLYDQLVYRSRISWKQVKPYMKTVKTEDGLGVVHAHISALVQKSLSEVESLDSGDLSIARNIATFFL